jgi:hypothetical protein
MKTFFRIFCLIIMCIMYIPYISSCSNGSQTNLIEPQYWYIDPPDIFNTNSTEKAQEEIPFRIIVPTYFPDNLKPYPSLIRGPVKNIVSKDETVLKMQYQEKHGGTYQVFISEVGSPINAFPADDSKITNLVFYGVQVLEEEIQETILPASGGQETINGLKYYWNRNNMHFEVNIYDYSSEVSRMIVESMIK